MKKILLFYSLLLLQTACFSQSLHIGISGGITPRTALKEMKPYEHELYYTSLSPINGAFKLFLSFRRFDVGIGFETGHLTGKGFILEHDASYNIKFDQMKPLITAPYYVANVYINGKIKVSDMVMLYGGTMIGYNFRAYQNTTILAQYDTVTSWDNKHPYVPMTVTNGGLVIGIQAGARWQIIKRLSAQVEIGSRAITYAAKGSSPVVFPPNHVSYLKNNPMTYSVLCFPFSIGINYSFGKIAEAGT